MNQNQETYPTHCVDCGVSGRAEVLNMAGRCEDCHRKARQPVTVEQLLTDATKAWVRHTCGDCDPTACTGTHDAAWYDGPRRRAIEYGWVTA